MPTNNPPLVRQEIYRNILFHEYARKMGQKGVLDHGDLCSSELDLAWLAVIRLTRPGEDLHFISLSLKMMIKSAYYMTKVWSNLCSWRLSKSIRIKFIQYQSPPPWFQRVRHLVCRLNCNNPEIGEDVAIKLVDEGLARMRDNCQDQKLKDAQ